MSEEKISLKLIISTIIEDWDDVLFFLLLYVCVPVCVLGYTYFISDRTILKGYNESLNEAIAYPETINHLSDIRYI